MTCQSSMISTWPIGKRNIRILGAPPSFRHGAEQNPLRMVAAAGEAPAAAEPMSRRRRSRPSARREARRRDGVRILAPDVALRLLGEIADHPVVLAVHGADPGRRAAALRQGAEHFREHAIVGGKAAEHRGLQATGQSEAAEIVDGFLRQAALGGGLLGALAQHGNERAGALDEDFGVFVGRHSLRHSWAQCHDSPSTSCPALCRASTPRCLQERHGWPRTSPAMTNISPCC